MAALQFLLCDIILCSRVRSENVWDFVKTLLQAYTEIFSHMQRSEQIIASYIGTV